MKKAAIIGASGMVGQLIIERCLNSSEIDSITSFVRRPSGIVHPKLTEVVIRDFTDYSAFDMHFKGIDMAFYCLGAYTGQLPDQQFKEVTYNYTVAFVNAVKANSPAVRFCFLSGGGADRTEKSKVSFALYKGMAENYLFDNLDDAYTFRPAYIYPVTRRNEPNIAYKIMRMAYPVIKLFGKNVSIESTELAEAMFWVALKGAPSRVLENKEILNVLTK